MSKSHVLSKLARLTQRPLNWMLGSKRPLPIDWRLDQGYRPPNRVFDRRVAEAELEQLHARTSDLATRRVIDLRKPYRILCLDGGGVRGALTTTILRRICEHNPNFLDQIDLICGTSAGGLLTLLLSSGYTAKECDEVYSFAAKHIFANNPWRQINPFRAKYSDKAKQELMMHYFGERTFADLTKTCAVVAFRLDGKKSKTHSFFNKEGWRPAVFTNMPRASGLVEPDLDLKVWDAAMCTSAAPTYFPVFRGYTDGGIVANNPSIIAISKAVAHYPTVTPSNIALLSIGAGHVPRHTNVFSSLEDSKDDPKEVKKGMSKATGLPPTAASIDANKSTTSSGNSSSSSADSSHASASRSDHDQSLLNHADWGIKQWWPFLVNLLLDGDSVTTEMATHYLLDGHGMYHRVDPRLPKEVALDDVDGMRGLTEFGNSIDLTDTFKFVDQNFAFDQPTTRPGLPLSRRVSYSLVKMLALIGGLTTKKIAAKTGVVLFDAILERVAKGLDESYGDSDFSARVRMLTRMITIIVDRNSENVDEYLLMFKKFIEDLGSRMFNEDFTVQELDRFDHRISTMMEDIRFFYTLNTTRDAKTVAEVVKDLEEPIPTLPVYESRSLKIDNEAIGVQNGSRVFSGTFGIQRVAVKIRNENSEDNFMREALMLHILSLRNVAGVVKFLGVDNATIPTRILLERGEKNLHEYLEEGGTSITLGCRLEILLKCCSIFAKLNDHKILHRDIKPENVLFTFDGDIRIMNFGFARSEESNQSKGVTLRGTHSYVAPELLMSTSNYKYSEATDMYSFAVMMNRVLTGVVPFANLSQTQLEGLMFRSKGLIRPDCVSDMTFPGIEGVSSAFAAIICICWNVLPSIRLTFRQLEQRLEALKSEVLDLDTVLMEE